jgi:hypothetical protein
VLNVVDLGNPGWLACTFATITVNEVNKPPTLMEPNRTVEAGRAATFNLCGSDPDLPVNALTYMRLAGPSGLTVNPDGRVNWMPTLAQLGTHAVTIKVTDNSPSAVNARQLSATNTFTVTVSIVA